MEAVRTPRLAASVSANDNTGSSGISGAVLRLSCRDPRSAGWSARGPLSCVSLWEQSSRLLLSLREAQRPGDRTSRTPDVLKQHTHRSTDDAKLSRSPEVFDNARFLKRLRSDAVTVCDESRCRPMQFKCRLFDDAFRVGCENPCDPWISTETPPDHGRNRSQSARQNRFQAQLHLRTLDLRTIFPR
jgi:hypothetical protein